MLTRTVHEMLSSKIKCDGPIQSQNSQIDCPIRERTFEARGLATGLWAPNQYAIDLERYIDHSEPKLPPVRRIHGTGQYL